MPDQLLFLRGLLACALTVLLVGPALAENPQFNYRLHCMGCHQADGSGWPEHGIPNMRNEVGNFLRVPGGRAYLSQVPGTLNTPLSDADTAAVLNWIMKNVGGPSVPADFKPYTEADVTAYRATVPEDIPGLRVKLLGLVEAGRRGD